MSAQVLKKINRFLAFVAFILLLFMIGSAALTKGPDILQKKIEAKISSDQTVSKEAYEFLPSSPLTFDEKLFSKPIFKSQSPSLRSPSVPFPMGSRGLMGGSSFAGGPLSAGGSAGGSPGVGSAVEQLKFIGVLPGDPPQAVLEDATKHKTYYLTKGQSEEGIVVEDIGAETVTVTFGSSTKQFPR